MLSSPADQCERRLLFFHLRIASTLLVTPSFLKILFRIPCTADLLTPVFSAIVLYGSPSAMYSISLFSRGVSARPRKPRLRATSPLEVCCATWDFGRGT